MTTIDFKPVKRCGECNHLIPADLDYCPYCQGQVSPSAYSKPTEEVVEKERKPMAPGTKRLLLVGGCGLIILIAGVLLWHYIPRPSVEELRMEPAKESVARSGKSVSNLVVSSHISMCINLYKDREMKNAFFQALQYEESGSDDDIDYWTRGCSYDAEEGTLEGAKPTSSLVMLSRTDKDVALVLFEEKVFNEVRNSLEGLLYEKVDEDENPDGDTIETYANANTSFPMVTMYHKTSDNVFPYNVIFSDNEQGHEEE